MRRTGSIDLLGATPAHPDAEVGHPVVVYDNHRFCAGRKTEVRCMRAPHMHSQIELNFVLQGEMVYWFDGMTLSLEEGSFGLFWG